MTDPTDWTDLTDDGAKPNITVRDARAAQPVEIWCVMRFTKGHFFRFLYVLSVRSVQYVNRGSITLIPVTRYRNFRNFQKFSEIPDFLLFTSCILEKNVYNISKL